MPDYKELPQDEYFQFTFSTLEVQAVSLAMTGLATLIEDGPGAAGLEVMKGIILCMMHGTDSQQMKESCNSVLDKFEALVKNLEDNPRV